MYPKDANGNVLHEGDTVQVWNDTYWIIEAIDENVLTLLEPDTGEYEDCFANEVQKIV